MASIPAVSTEMMYFNGVRAFDSRSPDSAADPTVLPVFAAFIVGEGYPDAGDWNPAEWEDAETVRVLIGPNGWVTLAENDYNVWLRVDGGVETPQRPVGFLEVGRD